MNRIVAGAACLNQVPLDWEGNRRRAIAAIEEARESGIGFLCLPELALTGYGCEDMFLSPEVGERSMRSLSRLAKECSGIVVAVGLPLWYESSVYNAVALIADGNVLGFVAKQNLAGDGLHYEPRWFKPWSEGSVGTIKFKGKKLPVGDLFFDIGGVRIGFEICEDAWVANRPGTRLAQRGVDLIFNPSASHFAFGKQLVRERFVLEGSRAFACGYVYANLLGNEAGRVVYDGGTVIAAGGEYVAVGKRFSFHDHIVTAATIDLNLTRMHQARQVSHRPIVGVSDSLEVKVDFLPQWKGAVKTPTSEVNTGADLKEEEFSRVVALGLFDYLRKSYSGGFVISLSGGADSAATAVLVKLMADLGIQELGEEMFRDRLGHICFDDRPMMEQLLACVYQSTRNSSKTTRDAAEAVAKAIGANYQEWDVDELVEGYRLMVEKGIGRDLNWDDDDIPLQNIQARVRAPGVWMLTNIRNALLLSTSNRSEAAVGYATMDGDTSGGLSPISGIDKAFLRHWLRWMEQEGSAPDIAAIPELEVINAQSPTAELRPSEEGQTDETDLMPYPILDAIEKLAIRDKKLPVEVWELMCESQPDVDKKQLRDWVAKFFRLWSRNQWKRERYAPGFHVDDKNLDPKTWCRFPILSGGFESELADLESRSVTN
ncbi:MAG: NAD(+) synthase [Verrucomicrobiales bacterium]|nr:NAD(+) synthase [Verrucomicrobiales bacterium]|tara:strand:+ start:8707 stop:10680 length:1974 start_codon:yes stop_codon:yes gene_type:complete